MKKWTLALGNSRVFVHTPDGEEHGEFYPLPLGLNAAQEYVDWQNSKLPPERYYAKEFYGRGQFLIYDRTVGEGRVADLNEERATAVANLLNEMEDSDG